MSEHDDVRASHDQFRAAVERLEESMARVLVGQREVVRFVLTALFCGGHVLLEGVPGLGKTLLVRTLAQALRLEHKRIQCTPDLMPADILGTTVILQGEGGERTFTFREGPVFTQLLLADEINRATPKTQSALLEAMQEASVTIAGKTRPLGQPFCMLATQNPLEMEGTYPLPEAQLDRFLLKIHVPYPKLEDLSVIIDRTTGNDTPSAQEVMSADELLKMRRVVRALPLSESVKLYALRLVLATHPDTPQASELAKRFSLYGASPRGAQALITAARFHALMHGRSHVDYEDIRACVLPTLRHRVVLNFDASAEGVRTEDFLDHIVQHTSDVDLRLRKEAKR